MLAKWKTHVNKKDIAFLEVSFGFDTSHTTTPLGRNVYIYISPSISLYSILYYIHFILAAFRRELSSQNTIFLTLCSSLKALSSKCKFKLEFIPFEVLWWSHESITCQASNIAWVYGYSTLKLKFFSSVIIVLKVNSIKF